MNINFFLKAKLKQTAVQFLFICMLFSACKQKDSSDIIIHNNPTPSPNPSPTPGPSIQNPYFNSLRTASVDPKGEIGDFIAVNTESTPYKVAHEVETALLSIQIKPAQADLIVKALNKNTGNKAVTLKKGSNGFLLGEITLSEGVNNIVLLVEATKAQAAKTGENEKEYALTATYKAPAIAEGEIQAGVFCADARKPSPGEKDEFLWIIIGQGACPNCPAPLEAAGKVGKLYDKYKSQGLRVVAITAQGVNDSKWKDKLTKAGATYPSYASLRNVLYNYSFSKYVPQCVYIKNGVQVDDKSDIGSNSPAYYEQNLKKYFGFK